MTTTVDIEVAVRDLHGLLKLVSSGDEVVIAEGDKPLARLSGVTTPMRSPRVAGLHLNALSTSDDFDASLPDEFWCGVE